MESMKRLATVFIGRNNKVKVAVTGGSGFLGQYVINEIEKNEWEATIFSRKQGPNIIETDYSIDDLVYKLDGFEAVVHLAANRAASFQVDVYHSDEILTQNIYEACHQLKIKNIVYASSISVYSQQKKFPWSESQACEPVSMYGNSKLKCEHIGNLYNKKYNLNIKNLRFAHLFGFNEKNNYMINLFLRQAYNGQDLKVLHTNKSKREFLYAKDAAKAVVKALEASSLFGTFNIASLDGRLTNDEVARIISSKMGVGYSIADPDVEDPQIHSYMDGSYSENTLLYKPRYTFSEAISEIHEQMEGLKNVPIRY